ncbi:MAG: hypothetical protein H6505_02345 [Calditrichaeota bacterium]|nr:hypothetical protein [Calditrichota bacterium]
MMRVLLFSLLIAIALPVMAEETTSDSAATPQVTNVAYYFFNTVRCASCLKIEKYSHEAIETGFADQIASGTLTWMMKNLDEEENEHFIEDYKLFTKALVLVRYEDGKQVKWKNCDKVWELLNDEAEFKKYVEAQVAEFLGS